MPAAGALTVADKISDPMMPELDPSLLDFRPRDTEYGSKKDDPLIWNSQVLSEPSIETGRAAPVRDERAEFGDDDMNIDLDLGLDDDPSIELGRNALPNMSMQADFMSDDLLPKDLGFDDTTRTRLSSQVPSLIEDRDDQLPNDGGMLLDDGDEFAFPDNDDAAPPALADPRLQRDSQSPLSSALSSKDVLDATHINEDEEEEASMRQATHKAKKRKVLPSDSVTMLTSDTIKKQQADRSAILRPTSFLPRDPMLLNLMNMQKNGGFASSLMGDGQARGLAPELRGILSIEVVRKSGELKRKRDSGVADVSENDAPADMGGVQLEIRDDDDTYGQADDGLDIGGDITARDNTIINLPADDGFHLHEDDAGIAGREDEEELDAVGGQFDETTAPLLHPMEQGAISQGTKHAVHLLRDRFGSSADGSPSQQKKYSILFQELLPERSTSKADATKMFFETLVLATKDAIKVEQADKEVGSSIRVRAKRGLWGAWAEKEAGGEIAEQEAPVVVAATS